MEDDEIDEERKSLVTFKKESFAEVQSQNFEDLPEEEEEIKNKDEKYLTVDEDEERINGDKEEIDDNEEIELSSKDVGDVSLEKENELVEDKDEFAGEEEREEEEKEEEEEEEKKQEKDEEDEEDEEEEEDKEKKKHRKRVQKGFYQPNRQFREIIGKRESKKEELEKREEHLRQRLDVLECSMPAVMVWNVWQRMSQGAPIPNLHRLMEKQFRTPAAGEVCCPITPSRHYDCRVREIEAERKAAQRRLDEARILWLEKEVKLKERREKLEDAKRIQKERKEKIERLTNEAKQLKEALKKMNDEAEEGMAGFCESGECGDIQCRERWLRGVKSVDSIKASDVECLARLRQLAENELTMKKQIAELERREETYMRTLQHADEMWLKMEGDAVDTLSALQEQLDEKIKTNQQLESRISELEDEVEKLRAKMALCKSELTKYVSVERIEAITGSEDDFAKTTDKMVGIKPKIADKAIEKEYDGLDKEILMKVDVEDKEVSIVKPEDEEAIIDAEEPTELIEPEDEEAIIDAEKPTELIEPEDEEAIIDAEKPTELIKPEDEEAIIDAEKPTELIEPEDEEAIIDAEKPTEFIKPEDEEAIIDAEKPIKPVEQEKVDAIHQYLAMLGSLDELYADDDYGICSPEYECYEDWQEPETDEEPSTVYADLPPEVFKKAVPTDDIKKDIDKDLREPEEIEKKVENPLLEAAIDEDSVNVPLDKLRSWFDTVDSIRSIISKCPSCSVVRVDADILIGEIGKYAGVDAEMIAEITFKLTIEVEEDKNVPLKETPIDKILPEIKEEVIPAETIPEREVLPDMEKKPIEEVEKEIPPKKDEVELIVESPRLVPDEAKVILENPREEITEDTEVPIKEPEIEYDKLVPTKVDEIEEEIKEKEDVKDEAKIILPIQNVIDDLKKEDIIPTDDIDKDTTEEIELEKVVLIEEKVDVEDEIIEKLLKEELTEDAKKVDVVVIEEEVLKPEVLPTTEVEEEMIEPFLEVEVEEEFPVAEEIFVDAETLEEFPMVEDIPETLKDEIPIEEAEEEIEVTEEIPVEDKLEEMEERVLEVVLEEPEIEEVIEIKLEVEELAEVEPEEVEELAEVEPEEVEEVVEVEPEKEVVEVEPEKEVEEVVEVEPEEEVEIAQVEPEEVEEVVKVEPEEEVEVVKVEPEEVEVAKVEPEEVEVAKVEPEEVEVAKVEPEEVEEVEEVKPEEIEKEEVLTMAEKIEEVEPIEEMEKIEEIPVELIEEVIEPCLLEEEEVKKKPKVPIDPRIVAAPYLAVADIEEIKKEPSEVIVPKEIVPCVRKTSEKITRPPMLPPMKIIINKTEIVQTVIHKGTQTRTIQTTKIKTTDQKSTKTSDPEISSRKMRWQKRPKHKFAFPCSHVSSQTSTTYDSITNEKQRLLSNILKSLRIDLSTEEKEIRSINYNQKKFNEADKCNCCVCGKNNISPRPPDKLCNRPLLKDLKTNVPKIDKNIQDERTLKSRTLKSNITEKLQTCTSCASPKVFKSIKKICDQEICICSTSSSRSKKRIYKSEKKDQSCLAKMPKSKIRKNNCERKEGEEKSKDTMYQDKLIKCNLPKIKETKDQDELDCSTDCICTKIEKTKSGRLLKQEICGCEEL
ncbi:titin-like [Vespula squamosa]|uniref:Titin-like n=1 Tax=Vespula squamosa TaxID=30214 RepID=A0ABD2ARX7_VESSQ